MVGLRICAAWGGWCEDFESLRGLGFGGKWIAVGLAYLWLACVFKVGELRMFSFWAENLGGFGGGEKRRAVDLVFGECYAERWGFG